MQCPSNFGAALIDYAKNNLDFILIPIETR